MGAGQRIRGFVGQGMSGRRQGSQGYVYQFIASASAYTFTAPRPGRWKFVMWGPGADGASGTAGCSGAYVEIARSLTPGQPVTLQVGFVGTDTVATFRDGKVVIAGKGTTSVVGVASGGDVNLNGSLSGQAAGISNGMAGLGTGGGAGGNGVSSIVSGGGGAPARLPFRGGAGGNAGPGGSPPDNGATPGGGGGDSGGGDGGRGGNGLVLVYLDRG